MHSASDAVNRLSPPVRYAELAAGILGFGFRLLDTHSGYLCEITYGSESFVLGGGSANSWPLNSAGAASLATDKGFTSLVLSDRQLPTPRATVVFLSERYSELRKGGQERSDAAPIATELGWPIVAKPNNGSRGAFVQLCYEPSELERHLAAMSARYDIGVLQEYVEGEEYRVLVFDREPIFSYRKRRHELVGDGERSVQTLIAEYSTQLVKRGLDPIDATATAVVTRLNSFQLSLSSVPRRGVRFDVGIRANLAAGGEPERFTTEVPRELADLAIRAVDALGLRVGGVDIIRTPTRDLILEINSNPTISSLEQIGRLDLAVTLYKRQLEQLFGENKRWQQR